MKKLLLPAFLLAVIGVLCWPDGKSKSQTTDVVLIGAGDPTKGYYSINLGAWHIVSLNSLCVYVSGGCGVGSPEETWLANDLASHTQACTLALFHEPLYTSSSQVTPNTAVQPLWQDLY